MKTNIVCLDIGTLFIKGYDSKSQVFWSEANVYATDNSLPYLYGDQAKKTEFKTPLHIKVKYPMTFGSIADFNDMMDTLEYALSTHNCLYRKGKYLLSVPTDVTEVEKRAFSDLLYYSRIKASDVFLVERGIAEGIGCGFDMSKNGLCIINLGTRTEITILSGDGILLNRLIPIGLLEFRQALITELKSEFQFEIGEITAESLLNNYKVNKKQKVIGRNMITGFPEMIEVEDVWVLNTISPLLLEIVTYINLNIARATTDCLQSIQQEHIRITGGLAYYDVLTTFFKENIRYPVKIEDEPALKVIQGLKSIITNPSYQTLTYTMQNEDFRWLR